MNSSNNDVLSDDDAVGCGCLLVFLFILFWAIVIQNIILH